MTSRRKALKLFRVNKGYARMQSLKAASIHTSVVRSLMEQGKIEKVKSGLYRLADLPLDPNQGLIEACLAMPKAVVCLHSALSYYELSTEMPPSIMIALPRNAKPKNLLHPPLRVFYFSGTHYQEGIESISTRGGIIRIYCREKSIMDAFRFRNRLGLDVALEALREYMRRYPGDLGKLVNWSKTSRLLSVLRPYLEVFAR